MPDRDLVTLDTRGNPPDRNPMKVTGRTLDAPPKTACDRDYKRLPPFLCKLHPLRW